MPLPTYLKFGLLFMFVCMPIISPLATVIGLLLTMVAVFSRRIALASDPNLWRLSYISWIYFGVLTIVSFANGIDDRDMIGISPHLPFLYLPFLYLTIASYEFRLNAGDLARIALFISAFFFLLLFMEGLLVYEKVHYAPFGTEGNRRYWAIGFDYPRHSLLTGNPLTMADIAMPVLFAGLAGFYLQKVSFRFMAFIIPLASIAILYFTQNRSTVLVLVALTILAVIYLIISAPNEKQRLFVYSILAVTVSLVLLLSFIVDISAIERRWQYAFDAVSIAWKGDISSIGEKSMRIRLDYWQASLTSISNSPIWGYGVDNMMGEIHQHLQTKSTQEIDYHLTPHNWLLNQMLAGGVIALTLCTAFLIFPLYIAIMQADKKSLSWIYLGAIFSTSLMVSGLTNNLFFDDAKSTAFVSMAFMLTLLISRADQVNDYSAI